MKKLIALLLVAVMCFSLVACGGDTTEETSGTANQTTNETKEETLDLAGTWKGVDPSNNETTLLINADNTGHFTYASYDEDITWELNNTTLKIFLSDGGFFGWTVVTENDSVTIQYTDNDSWVLSLENN